MISLKSFKRGEKGFTLVELLIVIAILAVLAAVVIPAVAGMLGRGAVQSWQTDKKTIQAGVAAYYSDLHGATHDNADKPLGHYYPVLEQAAPIPVPTYPLYYPGSTPKTTFTTGPWEDMKVLPGDPAYWDGTDWAQTYSWEDYACIDMTLLKDTLPDTLTDAAGTTNRTPPMYYLQDYPMSSMVNYNVPPTVSGGTHYWVIDKNGTVFSIWYDSSAIAAEQYKLVRTAEEFNIAKAKYP